MRKKEKTVEKKDTFCLGGKEFSSRFILGSGKYSMDLIKAAIDYAKTEIITLAVRRTNTKKAGKYFRLYPGGCYASAQHFRCEKCG